jgi:hypothetical protein
LIVYFDTSAVVPIVIEEPTSEVASRLWDDADRVVSSRLVYVEGRAALAMAHRMDRLGDAELRAAIGDFDSICQQLDMVEVTDELVGEAGNLAQEFGLRGYDAVHLASAQAVSDEDLVVAAGDQGLLSAAEALGFATADLSAGS